MKTSVYRTSDDSALVSALIDCAEQGKQAVCLVELKARFDERRNIEWSRELEQAGVHVVHGFPDMKIHAKMTLVVRREAGGLRRYVHIGTGNYHAATARLYEDVGLFTADEEIAADVADVFNYVTGFGRPQKFRKLLVAPFEMRARLDRGDPTRRRRRGGGREGADPAEAQQPRRPDGDRRAVRSLAGRGAGSTSAPARSACCGRGSKGSPRTSAFARSWGGSSSTAGSTASRPGTQSTVFIGSADLMPRNLDRRIEVLVPVENARARQELQAVLDSVFADDVHAWVLAGTAPGRRSSRRRPGKPVDHQAAMMRRAQLRARRQSRRPRSRK